MNSDGNSVNIEKKPYHHGDLRAALIEEGLRLLTERDAESFSLREVARNTGVSATSVYRHFPDKDALMTALAREGLAQLGAAQLEAAEKAGGGLASFAATGRTYVRFALANPALFRLIFASPALDGEHYDACNEADPMTFLRRNAAAAGNASTDDPATAIRVTRAWSLVHGLAMLILDGQIRADDALIDQVISADIV
nr:TetR/AcrR family transcriptional regulator [Sphingomonas sp. JC676]